MEGEGSQQILKRSLRGLLEPGHLGPKPKKPGVLDLKPKKQGVLDLWGVRGCVCKKKVGVLWGVWLVGRCTVAW